LVEVEEVAEAVVEVFGELVEEDFEEELEDFEEEEAEAQGVEPGTWPHSDQQQMEDSELELLHVELLWEQRPESPWLDGLPAWGHLLDLGGHPLVVILMVEQVAASCGLALQEIEEAHILQDIQEPHMDGSGQPLQQQGHEESHHTLLLQAPCFDPLTLRQRGCREAAAAQPCGSWSTCVTHAICSWSAVYGQIQCLQGQTMCTYIWPYRYA
jgi:hypothetical protein